jgi:hypothetical protein
MGSGPKGEGGTSVRSIRSEEPFAVEVGLVGVEVRGGVGVVSVA